MPSLIGTTIGVFKRAELLDVFCNSSTIVTIDALCFSLYSNIPSTPTIPKTDYWVCPLFVIIFVLCDFPPMLWAWAAYLAQSTLCPFFFARTPLTNAREIELFVILALWYNNGQSSCILASIVRSLLWHNLKPFFYYFDLTMSHIPQLKHENHLTPSSYQDLDHTNLLHSWTIQ